MKLTIGFSPCPNDTFIFDALVNNKIDTEGLEFDVMMEDVETLNQWAFEEKLDITKLSFPGLFANLDTYALLHSGAALGKGVGPLLISKKNTQYSTLNIQHSTIALPGKNTTANLLFSLAYPGATKKRFMIFSAVEEAVLNGETDLGVIIHENRFTYQQKGLHKVMDLGEHWEEKMKLPIPLGGIAIKRTVDKLISLKIEKLIRKSIEFGSTNYPVIADYVKQYSQEMSEDVMRQHIELYVNDYTLYLSDDGKKAIDDLHFVFKEQQLPASISHLSSQMFLS